MNVSLAQTPLRGWPVGVVAASALGAGRLALAVKRAGGRAVRVQATEASVRASGVAVVVVERPQDEPELERVMGARLVVLSDPSALDWVPQATQAALKALETRGEAMVQGWLERQQTEGLQRILLEAIRDELLQHAQRLTDVLADGDVSRSHEVAHAFKGWVGYLRLDQVLAPLTRVSDAARDGDLSTARDALTGLQDILGCLPPRYRG